VLFKTKLIVFLLIFGVGFTNAATIKANDMRGLRQWNEEPVILLDFSAIKAGTEDRTIAHFDINLLVDVLNTQVIELQLGLLNLDPGFSIGTIDIYVFIGDGIVSIDEWNTGNLYYSFSGIDDELTVISVDISEIFFEAISNGNTYLSFNFRTTNSDRYFLNSTIGGVTTSFGPFITFPPIEEHPTEVNNTGTPRTRPNPPTQLQE